MSESESEVIELIDELCNDNSVPKNVKETLNTIKASFGNDSIEIGVKIDSAIQMTDELGQDPNLSPLVRTQIYNLAFLLEDLNK